MVSGDVRMSRMQAMTTAQVEVVTRATLMDSLGIKTWTARFVNALAEQFVRRQPATRELLRA